MPTPIETVEAFFAAWDEPEGFLGAVRRYFTDATVWENVGVATNTGITEAEGFFGALGAMGATNLGVDTLAIAAAGNTVLTERVDYFVDANGKRFGPIRLAGILEVQDGKITAWRDYFDSAALPS